VFVFVLASAIAFVFTGDIGLKLVSAAALSVACGLAGVPLTQALVAIPRQLRLSFRAVLAAKAAQSPRLVTQFSGIAMTMHVPLRRRHPLKVLPNWSNACAGDSQVVLGGPVVDQFDDQAREGVIAHELAHLKADHSVRMMLAMCAWMPLAPMIFLLHLPWLVQGLVLFSVAALVLSSLSWRFEYQADEIAALNVGVLPVEKALRAFAETCGADMWRDCWSHPSLARRISRLQRMAA